MIKYDSQWIIKTKSFYLLRSVFKTEAKSAISSLIISFRFWKLNMILDDYSHRVNMYALNNVSDYATEWFYFRLSVCRYNFK